MEKPVRARTKSASGRSIGSPTSAATFASSTRFAPPATTSSGLPLSTPRKTSDLTICSTRQPSAARPRRRCGSCPAARRPRWRSRARPAPPAPAGRAATGSRRERRARGPRSRRGRSSPPARGARPRPARRPRSAAAAAVAARLPSIPLARNAATTPVSTSPLPAVARPGVPEVDDDRIPARRGDQRVRALEEDDGARVVRARLHRVEPVGRDPRRRPPEQPRRARPRAGSARSARRGRRPSRGARRAPRARRRRARPACRAGRAGSRRAPASRPSGRGPGRARRRPRARRRRGSRRPRPGTSAPSSSGARPRHHLDEALLEDEVQGGRHAGGDDARARRAAPPRRSATAPRSARASRRRRAPLRPSTCCRARVRLGTSSRIPAVARRSRVAAVREADVGDDDLTRVEAPRRDRVPDLRRVEGHRERRLDRGAGDPARRGVDPGGHVDRDDRDAPARSARRSPPRPPAAASPLKPVPKSASTARSAAPCSATNGTPASFARPSSTAASPATLSSEPSRRTAGSRPARRSSVATTSPSPPFAPVPHQTATRRASGKRREDLVGDRLAGALHQLERRAGDSAASAARISSAV